MKKKVKIKKKIIYILQKRNDYRRYKQTAKQTKKKY